MTDELELSSKIEDTVETVKAATVSESDARFLTELKRVQARRKIDVVSHIEERITAIAEATAEKLGTFVQEKLDVEFREMSMFQRLGEIDRDYDEYSLLVIEDDELPVVAYLLEHAFFRRLLSQTLTGNDKHAQEKRALSDAEFRLAHFFADHIASAVFENMEVIPLSGTPGKARLMSQEDFELYAEEAELVCFKLEVKSEAVPGAVTLMSPLALFESGNDSRDPGHFSPRAAPENHWKNSLMAKVDEVPMDIVVELSSTELPLSKVNGLQVGQRLELPINPDHLIAYSNADEQIFSGGIELAGKSIFFKVLHGQE